jgi:dTDP-4-dehydrorhamnose reductase
MHLADVNDEAATIRLIEKLKPDIIIHTAAEGRVDAVEGKVGLFRPINVTFSGSIAKLCDRHGSQFVFISSNAVFGGSPFPYTDEAVRDPINDYGRLKAEAEDVVRLADANVLILRPILMYGWPYPTSRTNPVAHWVQQLRAGSPITVVDDVWTEPLAAWDCAQAVWSGIRTRAVGAINVSGGVRMSLYDLAVLTASVFDLDASLVVAISSSSLANIAPRPISTSFDLVRLKSDLGVIPVNPAEGLATLRDRESLIRWVDGG